MAGSRAPCSTCSRPSRCPPITSSGGCRTCTSPGTPRRSARRQISRRSSSTITGACSAVSRCCTASTSSEDTEVPYVTRAAGVQIYWEEARVEPPGTTSATSDQAKEPLLLIMGLGATLEWWRRLVPVLSSRFRVIVYDNRGVGRSDVPPGPYPIAVMAEDAAAVLDDAGIESAHVFGASMGGMIAQELALNHPSRVRSL